MDGIGNQVLPRIDEVFRHVLGTDGLAVSDDTSPDDVAAWDSVGHLAVVAAVEREFGVRFTADEVLTIETVGDLRRRVEAKLTRNERR